MVVFAYFEPYVVKLYLHLLSQPDKGSGFMLQQTYHFIKALHQTKLIKQYEETLVHSLLLKFPIPTMSSYYCLSLHEVTSTYIC